MTKFFKGMSKDNFLDELVSKTGLNGHELFDHLMGILDKNELIKQPLEKKNTWLPTKEEAGFSGSRSEIIDYYRTVGGDEKIACYMGGMCPELVCVHCATALGVKKFVWTATIKVYCKDGSTKSTTRNYGVIWNPITLNFEDM